MLEKYADFEKQYKGKNMGEAQLMAVTKQYAARIGGEEGKSLDKAFSEMDGVNSSFLRNKPLSDTVVLNKLAAAMGDNYLRVHVVDRD